MKKEQLAKWLHDNYEDVAKQKEWNTQENCKVEFDSLPNANKLTMLEISQRLLDFKLLHLHFVSKKSDTIKIDPTLSFDDWCRSYGYSKSVSGNFVKDCKSFTRYEMYYKFIVEHLKTS